MKFDKIFLDLDGTIYIDNQIINKADEQIRRLNQEGLEFFYLKVLLFLYHCKL